MIPDWRTGILPMAARNSAAKIMSVATKSARRQARPASKDPAFNQRHGRIGTLWQGRFWLTRADAALYRPRNGGRNRVVMADQFDPQVQTVADRRGAVHD